VPDELPAFGEGSVDHSFSLQISWEQGASASYSHHFDGRPACPSRRVLSFQQERNTPDGLADSGATADFRVPAGKRKLPRRKPPTASNRQRSAFCFGSSMLWALES
jgi:hypothetical protein